MSATFRDDQASVREALGRFGLKLRPDRSDLVRIDAPRLVLMAWVESQ